MILFRLVRRFGLEPVHLPGDSEPFGLLNALAVTGLLAIQKEYHDIRKATLAFRCTKLIIILYWQEKKKKTHQPLHCFLVDRIAYLCASLFFLVMFSTFTAYLTSLATANKMDLHLK